MKQTSTPTWAIGITFLAIFGAFIAVVNADFLEDEECKFSGNPWDEISANICWTD
jgi:hypothetical protein